MALHFEGCNVTVDDELRKWLQSWDLQQYAPTLHEQAIKKPKDFIFVKTKQHFDELMFSLGANMPFMDKLKFEDAWKSIVPKPQKKEISIHFLEQPDKEILMQLNQRFDDLSKDITTVKNAFKNFSDSVVVSKKTIDNTANFMILAVNTKKKELLQKINDLQQTLKNKFEAKLNVMEKMNRTCLQSKDSFNKIAVSPNITSLQKTNELKKLLSINTNTSSDDEKHHGMQDNYDHHSSIGNECVIPGKIVTTFDETQFNNSLQSSFKVNCNNITSQWNLQQYYNVNISSNFVKFSNKFRSKGDVFIVDNEKGIVSHHGGGAFHYILTDGIPVFDGIHCWRVKTKNQRDAFWGISQPQSCTDRAFANKTFFGIGPYGTFVSIAGKWSGYHIEVAPFNQKSVVFDMRLNCKQHTLEFHLVDENKKSVFKMNNISNRLGFVLNNDERGWVLCFCLRQNDQSVQVTKIDNQWCGDCKVNAFG